MTFRSSVLSISLLSGLLSGICAGSAVGADLPLAAQPEISAGTGGPPEEAAGEGARTYPPGARSAVLTGRSALPDVRELRSKARAAVRGGHPRDAVGLLERAVARDPDDIWAIYELAHVHDRYGDAGRAASLRAQLHATRETRPEALYAAAQLDAEADDWNAAVATLDRVPSVSRTADMVSLRQRAWLSAQVERVRTLVDKRDLNSARTVVEWMDNQTGSAPACLMILSEAYDLIGEKARAGALVSRADAELARESAPLTIAADGDEAAPGSGRERTASARKGDSTLRSAFARLPKKQDARARSRRSPSSDETSDR